MYRFVFILLGSGFFASTWAQQVAIKKSVSVKWKPVAVAHAYRLQLKTDDDPILDKVVTASEHSAILSAGDYQFRLAVLDENKKELLWSPWQDLVVTIDSVPEFTLDQVKHNVDESDPINIPAKGLTKVKSVRLLGVNQLPVRRFQQTELGVTVQTRPLNQIDLGKYDLEIQTVDGLYLLLKEYVVIKRPLASINSPPAYGLTAGYLFINQGRLMNEVAGRYFFEFFGEPTGLFLLGLVPGASVSYAVLSKNDPVDLDMQFLTATVYAKYSARFNRHFGTELRFGPGVTAVFLSTKTGGKDKSFDFHEFAASGAVTIYYKFDRRSQLSVGLTVVSMLQGVGRVTLFSPGLSYAYTL